jgi:hypothetical protein
MARFAFIGNGSDSNEPSLSEVRLRRYAASARQPADTSLAFRWLAALKLARHSGERKLVTLAFASWNQTFVNWNQIAIWLRRLEALRQELRRCQHVSVTQS